MQLQVTAIRQQSALIIIYSPDSSEFCIYTYEGIYFWFQPIGVAHNHKVS